jgi:DNA-binding MarR family transcriptional regulator
MADDTTAGASPVPTTARALLHDPNLLASGLLYEAQAALRTQFEAALSEHDLTTSAFEVLVRLARAPGGRLRMSDLASQTTLSASGLTRVVDRLEATRHVRRRRDAEDRRVLHAELTGTGGELLAALLPGHLATIEATITDALRPDELRSLTAALLKICRAAGSTPDDDLG